MCMGPTPNRLLVRLLAMACLLVCSCDRSDYRTTIRKYESQPIEREVRALWIVRDALREPENIGRIVTLMSELNLNTALVQVRGRGDAYYTSGWEPRAQGLAAGFDPLRAFLSATKGTGIEVHAWVNAMLIADADTRRAPYLQRHVVSTFPQWVLRNRAGRSLWDFKPEQWKKLWVKGAFLNPALPEVRQYTVNVLLDLLRTYSVKGLHLDYIRYPYSSWQAGKMQWGIDAVSLAPLSQVTFLSSDELIRDRSYSRLVNIFRSAAVTALVKQISTAVRREFPETILSAATIFHVDRVNNNVFQDWPRWLRLELIDYAYLMSYKGNFHRRMEPFYDPALMGRYVVGVGMHLRPKPSKVRLQIDAARALGAAGIAYFSHQWFFDHSKGPMDYDLLDLMPTAVPSGQTTRLEVRGAGNN